MRKLLTVLLVVALSAALLSGCTTNPTKDPSKPDPTPTQNLTDYNPDYSDKKDPSGVWDDVITFNLFNQEDYQTRWSNYAKEWMLESFHIKVGYVIPAVTGFSDTWAVCQNKMMEDPANRDEYRTKLVSLFISEKTRPDYLPSVYGSCMGSDGVWFDLVDYLVDLAPYVSEGGPLYEGYVEWLWGDAKEYWEEYKHYLMTEFDELFVLPRREMMPVQFFLGYSQKSLNALGISWDEKPTDWNGFVELLRQYKGYSDESSTLDSYLSVPFKTTDENGADLLQFVATTYGLDFNADFTWTTKNGEPLWTPYWDEYLSILKDVNMLASEGLVCTNLEYENCIANYTLDTTDPMYQASVRGMDAAGGSSGIAGYVRDDKFAWWSSDPRNPMYWSSTDEWITHDGYEYSLVGGSQFDSNYLAIGNALGPKFTSRIIDFWNASLCDEGYFSYQFGRKGTPFADNVEDAGSYLIDEDGKVIYSNHENRFSFVKDSGNYWWATRDENWWIDKDVHYEQYIANYNATAFANVEAGDGTTVAVMCGIEDTLVWENSWNQMLRGTWFYADVTAYPMSKTAYWPSESMSKAKPYIDKTIATATDNNSICYKGFYSSTKDILGKESNEMIKKITALQTIAKNFTVKFLSHEASESDWTNYIKSLQDAGYDEVYSFYVDALKGTPTKYQEGVASQSTVNAKRAAKA